MDREITDGQKRLYEKRRIKKEIKYHEGLLEAYSFVVNEIDLLDEDLHILTEKIEQSKDRIDKLEINIKRLNIED